MIFIFINAKKNKTKRLEKCILNKNYSESLIIFIHILLNLKFMPKKKLNVFLKSWNVLEKKR